jgi:hypothetical protein
MLRFKIYFRQKIGTDIAVFFAQITDSFCKNLILTLAYEKNANFLPKFAKNLRKLGS